MSDIQKGIAIHADIPSPEDAHLFFVLSDPVGNPPKVAMVNISTKRNLPFEDHTVVLQPGDHSFIRHDSFVYYEYARLINVEVVERKVAEGKI
ncbi:hypothetical protein DJ030_12680 [bacterium endosymbiont of Escarpia laminata]|nr:MAG: hypothetical protein DJ030_12680 [bacterium endosymbiont of Escarpia laminata]